MPRKSTARKQRQSWRPSQRQRAHKTVYDAAGHIRHGVVPDIDATPTAKFWVCVGLNIAASVLEKMANELLVEDIINETE